MLPKLKPPELKELLPGVTGFISHPSVICRQRMYDILMWIYDNYRCVRTADVVFQWFVMDKVKAFVTLSPNFTSLGAGFFQLSEEQSCGVPKYLW